MMRRFVLTSSSPSPFLPIASPSSPNIAAAAAKSFPLLSSATQTQRAFSTVKPNFSPDQLSSVSGTHDDGGRSWGREIASAFSSQKSQSSQHANADASDSAPFVRIQKPTAATSNDALAPSVSREQLGYDHARQPSRDFWLEMSSSADTLPLGGGSVAVPSHHQQTPSKQQHAKGRGPTAIRHSVSSQPAAPFDDFEAVVAKSGIIMDGQGIAGSRGGGVSSDIQLGIARRFLSGSAASISNAAMAGSTRKFATSAAVNAEIQLGDRLQKESPPTQQRPRLSGRKAFVSPNAPNGDTMTPTASVSQRLSQWSMRTTDDILPRVSAKGVDIWLL